MEMIRTGNTLRLIVHEPWTIHNNQQTKEQLKAMLKELHDETILVDFSEIPLIDSTGLKLVIGIYQTCASRKLPMEITAHSPALLALFDTTGLNRFIKINQVCPLTRPAFLAKAG